MAGTRQTDTIAAENTFSTPARVLGHFNVSISGTWQGILWLQRKLTGQETFNDVSAFTDNIEIVHFEPEVGALYRIGAKEGEFTSGSAVVRISQ